MFKVLDDVHHGLRVLCQLQLLLPVLWYFQHLKYFCKNVLTKYEQPLPCCQWSHRRRARWRSPRPCNGGTPLGCGTPPPPPPLPSREKNQVCYKKVKNISGMLSKILDWIFDNICQILVPLTAAACASQSVNSFFIIALLPTIRALERKALWTKRPFSFFCHNWLAPTHILFPILIPPLPHEHCSYES